MKIGLLGAILLTVFFAQTSLSGMNFDESYTSARNNISLEAFSDELEQYGRWLSHNWGDQQALAFFKPDNVVVWDLHDSADLLNYKIQRFHQGKTIGDSKIIILGSLDAFFADIEKWNIALKFQKINPARVMVLQSFCENADAEELVASGRSRQKNSEIRQRLFNIIPKMPTFDFVANHMMASDSFSQGSKASETGKRWARQEIFENEVGSFLRKESESFNEDEVDLPFLGLNVEQISDSDE